MHPLHAVGAHASNTQSMTRHRLLVLAAAATAVAGMLMANSASPAAGAMNGGPQGSMSGAVTTSARTAPAVTSEQTLARLVNADRSARGLKPYAVSASLSAIAEEQAREMAKQQRLFHNPDLTTEVKGWRSVGENVAYTSSVARAHTLLMGSPPHRANLLSTGFTQIGLGVVKDSRGTVWVVEVFRTPA